MAGMALTAGVGVLSTIIAYKMSNNKVDALNDRIAALELQAKIHTNSMKAGDMESTTPYPHEVPDWKEAPTVADDELVIYTSPICPFAHRATIAAVEKLGPKVRIIKIDLGNKPTWYKDVCAELTVPALQHGSHKMGDSIPCCAYINDNFTSIVGGDGVDDLLPLALEDPAFKKMDDAMTKFSPDFIYPCYRLLRGQDPSKDHEFIDQLRKTMVWFDGLLDNGPFFLGDKFSMFEITTFPFILRFSHTLKYWRGYDILEGPLKNVPAWLEACKNRESNKVTERPGMYYIQGYATYAGGRGRSQPGQ